MLDVLKRLGVRFKKVDGSSELRLQCPSCKEQGLSFTDFKLYFNLSYKVGHCKRCDWRGGLSRLLSLLKFKEVVVTTAPSLRRLTELCSFEGVSSNGFMASNWPVGCTPVGKNRVALSYLRSRGLNKERSLLFGLYYCPSGFYGKRIIIPVFDSSGNYETFVARSIKGVSASSGSKSKYLYPKGCKVSQCLYPLHLVGKRRSLWLVEGVFDAMHVFPYGVATFGKHLSQAQIELLRDSACEEIVLLWDWDAWHVTPTLWRQALEKLSKYFVTVAVCLPKPKTDPANYSLAELKSLISNSRQEVWGNEGSR